MYISTPFGPRHGIQVGTSWLYHDDELVIGYDRGAFDAGLRTWFFATGLDNP